MKKTQVIVVVKEILATDFVIEVRAIKDSMPPSIRDLIEAEMAVAFADRIQAAVLEVIPAGSELDG